MESENNKDLNKEFFNEYKSVLLDYVEERVELAQIAAVEKSAVLTGKLAFAVIILAFGLFALFFMNILLALYLSKLLESYILGVLIVTGFYLFMILLTILLRRQIEGPITNMVVKNLMSKNHSSH